MNRKIFYGWFIVLAGFLIAFAGLGVVNSMSGVLLVPITDDLGFYRAEFTLHRTIMVLAGACFVPFYGRLYERFGVKKILLASSAAVAIITFAYSFATNIWHFYLLALLNGAFISGPSFMTIGYIVNNWFEDKKGLAMGVAFAGAGFGSAALIPVASHIAEIADWRVVYRFSGIVILAIMIPVTLFLLKERPQDVGAQPYRNKEKSDKKKQTETSKVEILFNQAVKMPIFWLLMLSFFLLSIMAGGPNFNAVPYLTDIGYSAAFAAMVMSVLMITHTLGNMSLGGFFDRFGMLTGSIFLGLCCIIFPILALNAEIPIFIWLFALFYGPASSGFSVPVAIFVTTYFGRKDFAVIFSLFNTAGMVGTALSGPSMAVIYDITGSYFWGWIMLLVFGLVITVCLVISYFMNRARPPLAI